jgi:hypothetical protein
MQRRQRHREADLRASSATAAAPDPSLVEKVQEGVGRAASVRAARPRNLGAAGAANIETLPLDSPARRALRKFDAAR